MNITEMRNLQLFLLKFGLYSGPIDGIWRPAVSAGVDAFQAWAGLPQNGTWTTESETAAQYLVHYTSNGTQAWDVYGTGMTDIATGATVGDWSLYVTPTTQGTAAPEPTPQSNAPAPTNPNVGNTTAPAPIDWTPVATSLLQQFGLATPELIQWMDDLIVQYDGDVNAVEMLLYQRPEFQARFPSIFERQQQGASPLSARDVLAYEQDLAAMLHASGVSQFYGMEGVSFSTLSKDPKKVAEEGDPSKKDGEQSSGGTSIIGSPFQQLVTDLLTADGGGVSIAEVSDRLNNGFLAVAQAPQAVRDYFASNYGASGEAALAAYFLNPDLAAPELERQAQTAGIGGRGAMLDIGLSLDRARLLADMGLSGQGAMAGFQQLDQIRTLFQESLGDIDDLTIEGTGVDAQFGVNPGARRALTLRQQARSAQFSGGGEALLTSQGASGFGSS